MSSPNDSGQTPAYYVPESSPWPFVGAIALFLIAFGAGTTIKGLSSDATNWGAYVLGAGIVLLLIMLWGWFANQIDESMSGLYSPQLSVSYRQGMVWFIFSEVMFFLAFFGALFYARVFSVPWLGGDGNNAMTHLILWEQFIPQWPLTLTPDGTTTQAMPWHGIPLWNTLILLTSSVTVHFAHLALLRPESEKKRGQALGLLCLTVLLGAVFVAMQIVEYFHAYQEMSLRLDSGIYGSTFFLLTGFHGLHVTLGTIFLAIIACRMAKGHFSARSHFAFKAASWYWHFVDVVWLGLFLFVYIV